MGGEPLSPERRAFLAGGIRGAVLRALQGAPVGTAVLTSGGVDSQLVLRALVELGKKPVALSFRLVDRASRDWLLARETAADLGVRFMTVPLRTNLEELLAYVSWAVGYGLRGKAAIECFWPRRAAIEWAVMHDLPAIATGDGGDGYHCLSKKGMIHSSQTVALMDEYRRWYYGRPNWSQVATIREYAAERGLSVFMPLEGPDLFDLFAGLSWGEVNKPKQKILLREAFQIPDRIPRHTNLQLGDSGIADLFKGLTPEGARSPVVLYNQLARAEDSPEPRPPTPSLF